MHRQPNIAFWEALSNLEPTGIVAAVAGLFTTTTIAITRAFHALFQTSDSTPPVPSPTTPGEADTQAEPPPPKSLGNGQRTRVIFIPSADTKKGRPRQPGTDLRPGSSQERTTVTAVPATTGSPLSPRPPRRQGGRQ